MENRVIQHGLVSTPCLRVDESLLTGESYPVERAVSEPLLAGTIVSSGSGLFEVTATGARTTLGQIGLTVKEIVPPQSSLRRDMVRLTHQILGFAAAASLGLGVALFILWDDWARAALAGLTLTMMLTAVFIAVTLPAASAAFRFQPLPPFLAIVAMGIGLLTLIPFHTLRQKFHQGGIWRET